MTPIEELRPYLDKHVRVRVLNALMAVGIESIEELLPKSETQLWRLHHSRVEGHWPNMGRKSVRSLRKALDHFRKETGVTIKLDRFLVGIAIKELSPDKEYILEFEMQLNGRQLRFQSDPMPQNEAIRFNTEINLWTAEYNKIRRQVGMLHDALKGVTDVVERAHKRLKDG